MSEEDLLQSLGKIARENERDDQSVENELLKVARGEASFEQVPKTIREHEEFDSGKASLVFAPLKDAFVSRAARSIGSELEQRSSNDAPQEGPGRLGSNVSPLKGRGVVKIVAPILGLAAAAVLVFVVFDSSPVPEYTVAVVGGDKVLRGEQPPSEDPSLKEFSLGASLEIVLKPTRATHVTTSVWVYLVNGEEIVPVNAPVEKDERGAIRVFAVVGEHVSVRPGTWQLVVAVGLSESPPSDSVILGDSTGEWSVYRKEIAIGE